jgi:Tol biopolymer transport system component
MLRLTFLLSVALLGAQAVQPPAAQPPAPPGTDIHLISVTAGVESLKTAKPTPLATERGYENQPAFTRDGRAVLFTADRDGKQTDIFEFDRATGRARPLLTTAEGEYSATITADGAGFSVIRVEADGTQRLWRFDRDGSNPRVVLRDVKPVGYHAWVDADRLALFVLGKPATLQLARVSTGRADIVASDIGRSIHAIPERRAISFVQREASGEFWVKTIDADTQRIERLIRTVPDSTERDCAWMPDGTLLMSSGTRLFAWRPGEDAWREVFDVAPHGLGALSRVAVSPDGRTIAIVVAELK